jgi:hypothetical protein
MHGLLTEPPRTHGATFLNRNDGDDQGGAPYNGS